MPADAQKGLLGAVSSSGAPSPDCVIKSNVNQKGERIYHLLGQLDCANQHGQGFWGRLAVELSWSMITGARLSDSAVAESFTNSIVRGLHRKTPPVREH